MSASIIPFHPRDAATARSHATAPTVDAEVFPFPVHPHGLTTSDVVALQALVTARCDGCFYADEDEYGDVYAVITCEAGGAYEFLVTRDASRLILIDTRPNEDWSAILGVYWTAEALAEGLGRILG